jgi:hypothetical protein
MARKRRREVVTMVGAIVVISFIVLVGPLALFLGVDSRVLDDKDRRGWWPGRPR